MKFTYTQTSTLTAHAYTHPICSRLTRMGAFNLHSDAEDETSKIARMLEISKNSCWLNKNTLPRRPRNTVLRGLPINHRWRILAIACGLMVPIRVASSKEPMNLE